MIDRELREDRIEKKQWSQDRAERERERELGSYQNRAQTSNSHSVMQQEKDLFLSSDNGPVVHIHT